MSAKGASTAACLATRTIKNPSFTSGYTGRSASRSRLRVRFRTTAFPRLFETVSPTLVGDGRPRLRSA